MPPSGADGLARLGQGGIDVVALDQYMPGLDGMETLEQILSIPDAPPVVFVTAAQAFQHRGDRAQSRRRRLSGQGCAAAISCRCCRSRWKARSSRR